MGAPARRAGQLKAGGIAAPGLLKARVGLGLGPERVDASVPLR